jgi:branched-chain amino acid transport system substrate-binding protein
MTGGVGDDAAGRVNTVAVPLVLGCFAWAAETPNFMALARLADLLAQHGSGLPGFDMTAPVSGWQRFAPVDDWLARGRSGSIRDYAAADTRPPVSRARAAATVRPPAAPAPPLEPEQKEKLFQEFLNWRRNRQAE